VIVDNGALRFPVSRAFAPLLGPAPYKGAHGGRATGKSHFFGEQTVANAIAYARDDYRQVCIREIQSSLRLSSKALIEDKIRKFRVQRKFRIMRDVIEIRGGYGLIAFQGMQNQNAESIKSLEDFDVGWVDEAQTLSEKSLRIYRPTLRKKGAERWFSWNPRNATDPVDVLLRTGEPPPGAVVIGVQPEDNAMFPDESRAEMLYDYRRDPEMAAHVWGGAYETRSKARVFDNWTVEEFETPTHSVAFMLGADWGFSTDPTVLIRCYVDVERRKLFVDRELWKLALPIDATPRYFDSLVPEEPGWARKWPIAADSARPETIDYMQRNGYPKLVGARKGAGSVEEGVEFLKNWDIVVHSRCVRTRQELAAYKYKVDKQTELVLPELEDRDNNVIDALRYAVENLRLRRKRAGVW
jgi:phage terminase large subunit